MLHFIARKIFGTRNDRILKSLRPIIAAVAAHEPACKKMSDAELRSLTAIFKERVERGESLDRIMPEAFAAVREASVRSLGMRHFDVQLIGGAILHRGMITEMKTGEGKTLVATLAAYLNALSGKGVHVVTVNDYLAKRDSEWMGRIYNFLGMSVGVVYPGLEEEQKRDAYRCDITYGQNNEFGFDYLRDNMKFTADDLMQRGHNYAIVDEVDSILIDEARTPLIISGPAEDATETYFTVNRIIPLLRRDEHFEIDLKSKQPTLTEAGVARAEELLKVDNLYAPDHVELLHHVVNSLRAHFTMERDVDYVVKDGQVIIVDEFTGRLMAGRRWSNGLHQAVEAKENVRIARENQTLASITFQNLFRMYGKLSGMTGTADTEAREFKDIYNLEVCVIPTNMPMIREDLNDQVFKTRREKQDAAVEDIIEVNRSGQPILVGTISIEQSESLSAKLRAKGVPHNVLNAKHHEREAEIIAQAGRLGAITISTNMAGRGTDIMLGGNPEFMAFAKAGTRDRDDPAFKEALQEFKAICAAERQEVLKAGGLFILGTERHEARRIDNQLRGRAGRQGDPGKSRFYVSLEDDLMKRFGGERIQNLMSRFGWEEGMALDARIVSRSIENAQKKVEAYHYEMRKHVTEYDDVMSKQRQVVYNLRSKILFNQGIRDEILGMLYDLLESAVLAHCDQRLKQSDWDISSLRQRFLFITNTDIELRINASSRPQDVFDTVCSSAKSTYTARITELDSRLREIASLQSEVFANLLEHTPHEEDSGLDFSTIERDILLSTLDHLWNVHLQEMDNLRDGIGLRGYGQKNPLHEYQREGFLLFGRMIEQLRELVIRKLFYYEMPDPQQLRAQLEAERDRREEMQKRMQMLHAQQNESPAAPEAGTAAAQKNPEDERARLLAQKKARRRNK